MKRLLKNKGARTGVFFGATSGVITTVGLIAGLYAGTESVVAVLGGILVIAVADAMSDALTPIIISHYIGVWVHTAFA